MVRDGVDFLSSLRLRFYSFYPILFLFIFCLNMFFDISPVVYKQPGYHSPYTCMLCGVQLFM